MEANPHIQVPVERIEAFCRKWKVREFSLFGSVLRDDFTPQSDVDVMLVFDAGDSPHLEPWLDMWDELKAMFGREVDIVEKRQLINPFRRRHILTHRKVMYAA